MTIFEGKHTFAHGNIYGGDSLGNPPGIRVTPYFCNLRYFDGYIYVTQLCHSHQVNIQALDGRNASFPDFQFPLADGSCHNHNRVFKITRGESFLFWNDKESDQQTPYFWDSPFCQWEDFWYSVHYQIDFETLIQYSEGNEPYGELIKLAGFKWDLNFIVTRAGEDWTIENLSDCNIKKVSDSIKYYRNEDGIDPYRLRELKTTVDKYKRYGTH